MTDRDEDRTAKALQGMRYPAGRSDLITYAGERGANPKTMQALYSLPDRTYESFAEVAEATHQEPEGRDQRGGVAREDVRQSPTHAPNESTY